MPKNRKKSSAGRALALIVLGLTGLGILLAVLLQNKNIALLNPKGMIAQEQLILMFIASGLMLLIAVPALTMLYFTAWKYRESNTKAEHEPSKRHNKSLVLAMWLVPAVFAVVLSVILIPATHRLEPNKSIASDKEPVTIQVVAMRWKWVFIYPEQNIATVNFVQIPEDTPVKFELTADEAPMTSFWIPNLGGMLYAMTGHDNPLHLIADTPGDYPGSSAEINGEGFAGMRFTARASSQQDFDQWVQKMKRSPAVLDAAEYDKLLEPSESHPAAFYSSTEPDMYGKVLKKYGVSEGHHGHY
jgi:cytochrome o ubiquinol oxidase subunit 2